MESTLETHTLLHRKDIELFKNTIHLFKHYYNQPFTPVVHEDGSFTDEDIKSLKDQVENVEVIIRKEADKKVDILLQNHPLCHHFRFSSHHTIFKVKLFDPFILSKSCNVLSLDSDILFCKTPEELIQNVEKKIGCYLRDSWSAYCVPFRDEDGNEEIKRFINAGLTYFPTKHHYSLDLIEECLNILYNNGSRGATHPFLEQTCIAYLVTKQKDLFKQLPYPDYCVPTFGEFNKEHNLTALHLNSSPLVGKFRKEHYKYELDKIKKRF